MSTTLDQELALLRTAERSISRTSGTGAVNALSSTTLLEEDTIHNMIQANITGDNILIAPPGQRIAILEIFLWNTGLQTLLLKDGSLPLVRLTSMPAASGFVLGFAGNGRPHFKVTAGNPLVLNLSVGSLVDGFVKYRVTG